MLDVASRDRRTYKLLASETRTQHAIASPFVSDILSEKLHRYLFPAVWLRRNNQQNFADCDNTKLPPITPASITSIHLRPCIRRLKAVIDAMKVVWPRQTQTICKWIDDAFDLSTARPCCMLQFAL